MSARDDLNLLKMFMRHQKELRSYFPSIPETLYDKIQNHHNQWLAEYYERQIALEEREATQDAYTIQLKSEVKIK